MPATDVGSVWSRPSYLPRPCTTTRMCASGSPPRSLPEPQTASLTVVGAIVAVGAPPRPPPKRTARLPQPIPRAWVSAITMLQQTGDLLPPQVPQEGLGWEEKEGEWHEPSPEKCWTPGAQGRWPPLARHPTDVSRPVLLFNKRLCCTAHVPVITW